MRMGAWGDVLKVWLYGVCTVVLGAWLSPLFYNAGKALADISTTKTISDVMDEIAKACRVMDFTAFYQITIILVAGILIFPWMDWIRARSTERQGGGGAWRLLLPLGASEPDRAEYLVKNRMGIWHAALGFLIAVGLLVPQGLAFLPSELWSHSISSDQLIPLAMTSLLVALLLELFFRGLAMGVFLRAMSPAAAVGLSGVFFALMFWAFSAKGVKVADAEIGRPGFQLLSLVFARMGEVSVLLGEFLPWFVIGAVLAFARLKTASLWLPFGLNSGWALSQNWLSTLSLSSPVADVSHANSISFHGLLNAVAISIACGLAMVLTQKLGVKNDGTA